MLSGTPAAGPWRAGALPPPVHDLTREQQAAVSCRAHALAIHAGAGTGKTLTLAHRVARLGGGSGGNTSRVPHSVLAERQSRLLVVTFTREATASLQRKLSLLLGRGHLVRVSSFHQWAARELPPGDRRFLDEAEQRRILAGLLRRSTRVRLDGEERLQAFLGFVKNRETTVHDACAAAYPSLAPHADELERMRDAYEAQKGGRLDYDDVLLAFRDRLREARFRRGVAAKLDHVFVDEYQDVNGVQAETVHLLTTPRGAPRVTVVGDPRQSIYGFRGGAPAHLERFLDPYGARGRLVALTVNFRSARRILDAANAVEPGPRPMRARRGASAGPAPRLRATTEEAADALAHVEALLRTGVDPAEVAVLCRARHLAEPYQRAVARRLHEDDAADGLDRVLVRTIHAAKGLEWDHVVLVGAREGGLPSTHALRVPGLLDEERRLAYVAVTRARRSFVAFAGGTPSRFLAGLAAGEDEKWEKGRAQARAKS